MQYDFYLTLNETEEFLLLIVTLTCNEVAIFYKLRSDN
jgi:hypothetical protein